MQIEVLLVQRYLRHLHLKNQASNDALCRKDTKVYAYSMYESEYASENI